MKLRLLKLSLILIAFSLTSTVQAERVKRASSAGRTIASLSAEDSERAKSKQSKKLTRKRVRKTEFKVSHLDE